MLTTAGDGKTILIPPGIGYSEGRMFKTDIFRSDTGVEKRITQFETTDGPIRKAVFPIQAIDAHELALIQHLALYGQGNSDLQVPLWFSVLRLTADTNGSATIQCEATAYTEFASCGYALLLKADLTDMVVKPINAVNANSIVLGSAVGARDYEAGDYILPVMICYLDENVSLSHGAMKTGEGNLQFIEKTGRGKLPSVSSPENYLSYPVFDFAVENEASIDVRTDRVVLGEPWQARSVIYAELAEQDLSFQIVLDTPPKRRALTDFFDSRMGSYLPFWAAGKNDAFELSVAAVSGTTELYVRNNGAYHGLDGLTRHIEIPDTGDRCRIDLIGDAGDELLLSVTPAITGNLAVGSVLRNLYFVRFESDSISLKSDQRQDGLVTASLQLVELQPETPGA